MGFGVWGLGFGAHRAPDEEVARLALAPPRRLLRRLHRETAVSGGLVEVAGFRIHGVRFRV